MNNYNLLDILFLKKMFIFNQGSKIFGIYIYIFDNLVNLTISQDSSNYN